MTVNTRFHVENPAIARVDPDGTVRPVANGTTTLVARIGNEEARAEVVVAQFERDEPWSFTNHVEPVLTRAGCNQGSCHGAAAGKNGFRLTLRGYSPEVDFDVLTRQALGRRVVKTAPAESLMLLKPTGAIQHGGGVRFRTDSLEYRVIAEWIASGTPRPSEKDPTITGLTVYPDAVRLTPGDRQSIVVRATYSDGRSADVTGWAKFASTDETVARVDEHGRIHVEGYGEASVTVWYSSLVARATITVPSARPVDPKVFADAPRRNVIDEKNLAKLASLGIPPSPDSGDSAFLRRATLDATGTLPTAEAFEAFVADRDPARRSKVVDRLLASPEYVDYWAYKWSDLFLVSSKKLPAPAMWSFYGAIRRSVADNLPWDRFARAIVTAKGDSQSNGLANYFVLHRDPIDLTESASMAFLGLSLTCARCHNHPLEKWTQNQYYGMANLFARLKLKDGGASGDVVVMPAPEGDIHHPRTGAVLAPQPLDAKALTVSDRGDRREAFADWLASKDNPYFARAVVNRVWRNFFSRGLVDPEDDLRATNPASDEPLMEAARRRLRGARLRPEAPDPHHHDLDRLRAVERAGAGERVGHEVPLPLRGRAAPRRGPARRDRAGDRRADRLHGIPRRLAEPQLPDVKPESGTFLDAFGPAHPREHLLDANARPKPSMAQALSLLNGAMINGKLRADGGVVAKLLASGATDDAIVDRLFASALTRRPTAAERDRIKAAMAAAVAGIKEAKEAATARRAAVEDLYWSDADK